MLKDDFIQVCILVRQCVAQLLKILFGKSLYICHDYYYFTDLNYPNEKTTSFYPAVGRCGLLV